VVCLQEEIGLVDLPSSIVAAPPSAVETTGPAAPTRLQSAASHAPTVGLDFGQRTWEEVERDYATYLLERNHMNMTWAAEAAGVNRSTFVSRLRRLNLTLPRRRRSSR